MCLAKNYCELHEIEICTEIIWLLKRDWTNVKECTPNYQWTNWSFCNEILLQKEIIINYLSTLTNQVGWNVPITWHWNAVGFLRNNICHTFEMHIFYIFYFVLIYFFPLWILEHFIEHKPLHSEEFLGTVFNRLVLLNIIACDVTHKFCDICWTQNTF